MATTRASLVARVQVRANTSGYADPSTTIPGLVDVSLARLHNVLAAECYEDYYQKRCAFPIAIGQDKYQLPKDWMKNRVVWYTQQNQPALTQNIARYRLKRMDPTAETNMGLYGVFQNIPLGYALEDGCLTIIPVPTSGAVGTITMFYIPSFIAPQGDNDPIEFAVAPGWEEYVVNDVTHMIRLGAGMPAQEFAAERDAFLARIMKQAKNRDASEPFSVRDDGWNLDGGDGGSPYGDFSFGG
jgi:hypothetical protein